MDPTIFWFLIIWGTIELSLFVLWRLDKRRRRREAAAERLRERIEGREWWEEDAHARYRNYGHASVVPPDWISAK